MNRVRGTVIGLLSMLALAACGGGDTSSEAPANKGVLMDPKSDEMNKEAPETFRARFETSGGTFVIEVERRFTPHGADRFYNLVSQGYYNGCRFFRVVPNFMVQWGMNADPELTKTWQSAPIDDDPVVISNDRGTITFAKTGAPNSRTTQLFINFKDNGRLDDMGFAPFGRVVEGMDVVDAINAEYGEQPSQGQISAKGNEYLTIQYPNLDYIKEATIEE